MIYFLVKDLLSLVWTSEIMRLSYGPKSFNSCVQNGEWNGTHQNV